MLLFKTLKLLFGSFLFKISTFEAMSTLYNIFINCISVLLKLTTPFNRKLKLFIDGRNRTCSILREKINPNDRVIWFHCASLGEFEQGRPVVEKSKNLFPNHKIVISFFSPSGYEVRKNYDLADAVVYLPLDTNSNVRKFIELVHPELAVLVKYEFWPNLLEELNRQKITTILISGIFRDHQVFFKNYGGWMRSKLKGISHFFVQDENSETLLNSVGFDNVTLSGDTRFDRVFEIVYQNNQLDFLDNFKDNKYTLVAGSTWPDDEKMLIDYINNHSSSKEKFVIAPHNIDSTAIEKLQIELRTKSVLFSNYQKSELKDAQVFIVDTVGILTKVYSYADVAYVGGGFTNGIHNILEPATFGIPIIIGPKYHKFKEAVDLVKFQSCFVAHNNVEFNQILKDLSNVENRYKIGQQTKNYIKSNIGAVDQIIEFMTKVTIN